jgi:hypothetical protein
LREEHWLRMFEKRVLKRIFGPKRDEVMERNGENYIMRIFMICIHHRLIKSRRMRWV